MANTPVSVDPSEIRRIAGALREDAYPALVSTWDPLSRVRTPTDPLNAQAPELDVAAAVDAVVKAYAERTRQAMVEVQRLAVDLVSAAQSYEQTDREAARLYANTGRLQAGSDRLDTGRQL
jgi:hypothetical protein